MPTYSARAEWEPLRAVRVHEPGLETWSGSLDPASNLFEAPLPPEQAARAHQDYVDVLEAAGVTVHRLGSDLAAAGVLDDLVLEYADFGSNADDSAVLDQLDASEKLQLALARATVTETIGGPASVTLETPISNIYFQRDTTILGDRGPILCNMATELRQAELPFVEAAWKAIDADIVHRADSGPIEGGEFLPAGDIAFLGVSGVVDGEEEIIRTSVDAGRDLLKSGALGFEQVGLVRAPIEAERAMRERDGGPSRLMHLLGWFNIAAEGLAVTFREMAEAATVELFERQGDSYQRVATPTLLELLDERGYDVVDADTSERWPTNFVTVDDATVVALHEPGPDGDYRPEDNPTIEALKARGVTVLPDGTGLPNGPLENGAGGFHCMTTPVRRG